MNEQLDDRHSNDDGFGLVEIVVSIFILAILSLALLPLLINGVKQTTNNVTLAAATQLVDQQINAAQSGPPTCVAMNNLTRIPFPSTDSRGVALSRVTTMTACTPSTPSTPSTVNLTVTVNRVSTGLPLAQATTTVYING